MVIKGKEAWGWEWGVKGAFFMGGGGLVKISAWILMHSKDTLNREKKKIRKENVTGPNKSFFCTVQYNMVENYHLKTKTWD